jgi:23S rRNA (cytosine1962-C5)-methyltransferase
LEALNLLEGAIQARQELLQAGDLGAVRLFNGFLEGYPDLAVDLLGGTLVLHNYADPPEKASEAAEAVASWLREELPWVHTVILKIRRSPSPAARRGVILSGGPPDSRIREHDVWYAVDPLLNQDNSFYPDTRTLRRWAQERLAEKSVLNTFAYTGSLGVAALAGGAGRVVQLDRSRVFLNLAKSSYTLNGFPIRNNDFLTQDFYTAIGRFKRSGEFFDCVILDPPFFSTTSKGAVDLVNQNGRLINKVRPLIHHGGWLVVVNNALFLSGAQFMQTLESLCADGYLRLEEILPIPPDCTGYPHTLRSQPPADPAPFNHSTKIAILRVRRKGEGDFPAVSWRQPL